MDMTDLPLGRIIPYARNPRRNEKAAATVAASIAEFGWRQPIVVDEEMVVLAGRTRLEAARRLGLETAPVHVAKGLTEAQVRAYRLMDNRSGENAESDDALLGLELGDLMEAEFDVGLTGFTDGELDRLLAEAMAGMDDAAGSSTPPVTFPEPPRETQPARRGESGRQPWASERVALEDRARRRHSAGLPADAAGQAAEAARSRAGRRACDRQRDPAPRKWTGSGRHTLHLGR